ncbi:hypothetical protein D3C86_1681100 [compost metagenome]
MFILRTQLLQAGLDVTQGGESRAVQRLQAAGAHQAFGDGVAREDQVIPAATGEHFGFQRLTAIHDVVDYLDPGFGSEPAEGVLGEIVGPVVQPEGLLIRVQHRQGTAERQAQGADQQRVDPVHIKPLE